MGLGVNRDTTNTNDLQVTYLLTFRDLDILPFSFQLSITTVGLPLKCYLVRSWSHLSPDKTGWSRDRPNGPNHKYKGTNL